MLANSSHLTSWLAHVRDAEQTGTPDDVQRAIAEMLEHLTVAEVAELRRRLSRRMATLP